MSFAELQAEVDRLSSNEANRLMAYIAAKKPMFTPEVLEELNRKINDNDPAHWISLEEFGKRIGLTE